MKKISLLIITIISMISFDNIANASTNVFDKIAAIVNDDIITQKDLDKEMSLYVAQLQQSNSPIPDKQTVQKKALDQRINFHLQLQLAKSNKITATPKEVDDAIARIAKQNHLSVADFKTQLTAENFNYNDYRQRIMQQITISKVQQSALQSRIHITPQAVNKYINQHPELNTQEYHLQDLLISVSENASANEIETQSNEAKNILSQLKNKQDIQAGINFAKNKEQVKLIDLEWRQQSEIPQAFLGAAKSMRLGEIVGPIKTNNGFHLLQLAGKRTSSQLSQQEIKEKAQNALYQEQLKRELDKWMTEIRAQSYIKIMI